jgi:hypothetical protein
MIKQTYNNNWKFGTVHFAITAILIFLKCAREYEFYALIDLLMGKNS